VGFLFLYTAVSPKKVTTNFCFHDFFMEELLEDKKEGRKPGA